MDREWHTPLEGDAPCAVFVHGFLSSSESCWGDGEASWPHLLASSFPGLAVCSVRYNTSFFSGHYSVSDAADALHERLVQDKVLTPGRAVLFVCHSMGGLVVRRMIVQRQARLKELGLKLGLMLVASPSLGADYARWLAPLARFLGHTQADALRFSETNLWLNDLDSDFARLIQEEELPLVGRELFEDRLVVLSWLWFFPRVVSPVSGARYFPDPLKIPKSDHFSIAKPAKADGLQHAALCSLVEDLTGRKRVGRAAPVRVFLSYRHTAPDEDLALALARAFEAAGLTCFLDRRLTTGMAWQAEILRELNACSHFVVLLSAEAAQSEMVREEIAHAHGRHRRGQCQLLPVRVAFRGALPTDIARQLDPIQYTHWAPPAAVEPLARQLLAAIRGERWAPLPPSLEATTPPRALAATESGAPLPRADVGALLETGAQAPGDPLYVRRPADDQLEAALREPCTVLVSGPRQCGKSSLLGRAIPALEAAGCEVVYVDLQGADRALFEQFSHWASYLARQLARQAHGSRPPSVEEFQQMPMVQLTEFVEDHVLGPNARAVALVVDEADRLFGKPIGVEAFGLFRGWHNNRANKPRHWQHFSLLLAHSTEPYLWIPEGDQSPFNVGTRLRLEDFTLAQVRELAERIEGPMPEEAALQQVFALTGGQPYLTRLALHALLTGQGSLEDPNLATERGLFGDHLRALSRRLHEHPELLAALREILWTSHCSDERAFQRLVAAGLARGPDRHHAEIPRQFYRDYLASLEAG